MDPRQPHDLGHGVSVAPAGEGGLRIWSASLRMPWAARAGRVTGSAVIWLGEPYEVLAVSHTASGERWDLRPWPQNEVMRGVFSVDENAVKALHDDRSQGRIGTGRRWLTLPLLPILGLLPGKTQARWERDWGFPAATATLLSAVAELVLAALGLIQLLAQAIGGVGILPPALSWLGLVSPFVFIESVVRLKHFGAHQEPIGSAVGLPFALFGASKPVAVKPAIPEVRRLDAAAGVVELWSPIHRSDWSGDGILRFRDVPHQLDGLQRSGKGWLYRFHAVDHSTVGAPLRFVPAKMGSGRLDPSMRGEERDGGPGVFLSAVLTAFACMAPADLQRRWAAHLHVRPQILTVVGAGAELVGGLVNLRGSTSTDVWTLLDVFFVVEGGLRYAVLILRGLPVGSLIGLALRPVFEIRVPDEERDEEEGAGSGEVVAVRPPEQGPP